MNANYKTIPSKIESLKNEGKDLNQLFDDVVTSLKASFDYYDWVGIYLVEGENLLLRSFRGKPTQHTRIPIGEGICGWAAKTGETTVVEDVSKDKRYLMCLPETRSEIVVPIIGQSGILGEVDIDSSRLGAFGENDTKMLEKIATTLASAIESGV
jgi:GAF domain-containing protein